MPTATIEELAKLLAEEGRVEEKIRETRAALADIRKRTSESLVHRYVSMIEERVTMSEDIMKEEQSYERLLQALLDMKSEIAKQIRPVEEQIVQANVDQIKQMFEQKKNMLGDCLDAIKQKILDCRLHIEEYDRIRSDLDSLNKRLSRLGADLLPLPEPLPTTDLGDLITRCIEDLRSQRKL